MRSSGKREKRAVTDRGRLGCASTRTELSRILEFPLPKPFDSSDLQMSRQILVLAQKARAVPVLGWVGGDGRL